jgi:tryptophan synthase alpha subunit
LRGDFGPQLLVPYMTGGFGEDCLDVACVAAAGADAIEIDPVLRSRMDGPTIQEASRALRAGATPMGVLRKSPISTSRCRWS